VKFLDLVTHIAEVDDVSRMSAGRLVQQALSLRNWIIGAGVVEFEQSGEDRAAYGERLLLRLTDALTSTGCKGLSARNLKNFRQVALAYAGLDGFGMGRRLGLFPVAQRFGIRQTSAESPALLFPSLARRAAEHTHLPWRDSAWLMSGTSIQAYAELLAAEAELRSIASRAAMRFQVRIMYIMSNKIGCNLPAVMTDSCRGCALSVRRGCLQQGLLR
jgi:hypothetical protein